jgi:hypothetical protein
LKPAVSRWARHSCLAPMADRNVGPTKTPAAEAAGFEMARWPGSYFKQPMVAGPKGPALRSGPTVWPYEVRMPTRKAASPEAAFFVRTI